MKIAPIKHSRSAGWFVAVLFSPYRPTLRPRLSGSFFEELGIPDPDINLEVGSGTQADQTAALSMASYRAVQRDDPRADG